MRVLILYLRLLKLKLSPLFAALLHWVAEGRNIFLTGDPGTGKTFFLSKVIIPFLTELHGSGDAVAVTSSSAVSARLLPGGSTIHAWSGLKVGIRDADTICEEIVRSGGLPRWNACRCIIIDEASMVSGLFFDLVSELATVYVNICCLCLPCVVMMSYIYIYRWYMPVVALETR